MVTIVYRLFPSSNDALKKRVEAVLDMAVTTVNSLSESFITAGVPVVTDEAGLAKEKTVELAAIPEGEASEESQEQS
jgi:cleavage and polyadenylation specificity factor subunit 3